MASPTANMRAVALCAVLAAAGGVPSGAVARTTAPPAKKLFPGEALRYRVQYRSHIHSESSGPIYNPEQAHTLTLSLSAVLRLDVLAVTSDSRGGQSTRLRATYESSDARVQSDAYDAGAEALEKHYRELEGRQFEFTVDDRGRISEVTGLDRLEPDERARNSIRQWLSALAAPLGLWRPGMKPGAKWRTEAPLDGSPLAGLALRTQTTYRANEACPPAPGASPAARAGACAVIAAQLRSVGGKPRGDATPPAYRRRGLRTSGSWKASGQSLSYVSLATGLVTSSTASENDSMDLTIASTEGGSQLHYDGHVDSVSQITLVSVTLPASAPPASSRK